MNVPKDDVTPVTPDVPIQKIDGTDFSLMNRLVDGMEEAAKSKRPMEISPEAKMRELEMKRKALEIKV